MAAPVTISESTSGPNYAAAGAESVLVVVGTASGGVANTPAVARNDAQPAELFGSGRLVEVASYIVGEGQQPVVMVKAASAVDGDYGTIVTTGVLGTSVVTTDGTVDPVQDGVAAFRIIVGGTRGTAGITYQTSPNNLDWSETKALGTATQIDEPFTGARFLLAAGTLLANDTAYVPTMAPQWSAATLNTALASLTNYQGHPFGGLVIVGSAVDSTAWTNILNALATLEGKQRSSLAILEARLPNSGESESAYRTAMESTWASRRDNRVAVVAGGGRYDPSEVPQARYRLTRSMLAPFAARHAGLSYEQSHGLVTPITRAAGVPSIYGGPLRGFKIYDENNVAIGHNEAADPGLKDLRFVVATTYPQEGNAAFCDEPKTRAPDGDTVYTLPIRRMVNVFKRIAYFELTRKVQGYIMREPGTTMMAEQAAVDLNGQVMSALRRELGTRTTSLRFAIDRAGTNVAVPSPRIRWIGGIETGSWIAGFDGVVAVNKGI